MYAYIYVCVYICVRVYTKFNLYQWGIDSSVEIYKAYP